MTLQLVGLAGVCLILILANLEQRRRDALSSSALSAAPRSRADKIWHLAGGLCARLDLERRARFDPRNLAHRIALLLMALYVALVISMRLQGDDAGGIGLEPADTTGAMLQLAATAAMYLGLALLGVGWLTRRTFTAVIERLDLRLPHRRDWLEGLAAAGALFMLAQAGVALWAELVPPAEFEMQTSAARRIFDAFNVSLLAGICLALGSALGEEILFRGALQPVFGIVVSSLFFVLIHAQYLLTPAAFILFGVSLGFGWLRFHRGVSAAIIGHAAYNLLPFLIHRLGM